LLLSNVDLSNNDSNSDRAIDVAVKVWFADNNAARDTVAVDP
jgi:hypothetical protein